MRWIMTLVSALLFVALQAAVSHRIAIGSAAPDFIVVWVVLFGLARGAIAGAFVGFLVGVAVDLGNPGYLGLNALTKTVVGFAAGRLGSAASPGAAVLFVVFLVAALVHDVVYYVLYLWPRVGGALASIATVALPSALYTAVVGIVVERTLAVLGAGVVTPGGKERR